MSDSARLRLPNLAAGQAQKHVTVNEAEAILDILVQASVLDFATAPAGGESDGDCYIVTATATDEFTGWEGRIAFMRDGEWFSILPGAGDGEGWRAWVQAEGKFYVCDGAGGWSALPASALGNDSGVSGATIKAALDALAAAIPAVPVASVFGRTGAVAAATSDYDASQIDNDSGVAGSTVKDALDQLDADKQVALGFTPRETLAADRTYYVDATDGDDGNDGLASGSGNAFATLQHALDVCATIDFGGYTVTIQLADDTYTRADVPICVGQAAPENLIIQGNAGTPSNVIVDSDTGFAGAIHVNPGAGCRVKDIKTTTSHAQAYDLSAETGALRFSNIVFAGTGTAHISALRQAVIIGEGDYEIAGGATQHLRGNDQGCFRATGLTVTITGTPDFSNSFLWATLGSTITYTGHTFSGSATGKRYSLTKCSAGSVTGDPDTYLPGDATGSVDSTSIIS